MYDQQIREDFLYMMLYGAAAMLSVVACCYLLLRRSNAIAPDVTPPIRLRRCTAAFFASTAMSHVWYMPEFRLTSAEDILQSNLVGAMLDFMTLVPFGIAVLFCLLQDRRRQLWPAFVMAAPLAAITALCVATRSIALLPIVYAYYLLMGSGLIIYMVHEVRQYGHWLRDNYADLEHKEVWQSLVVLAVILSFFGIYTLDPYYRAVKYIMQLNNIILVCYLLWRVETLNDLTVQEDGDLGGGFFASEASLRAERKAEGGGRIPQAQEVFSFNPPPSTLHQKEPSTLQQQLQRHCIDTQLYLQHDLTAIQLARVIGTNRYYLSQYFSRQGITYNAYINGLRIAHFMSLYRKAVADQQSFTAQQLATESGFHNYRTFSNAFKQQTGQTVTGWMKAESEQPPVHPYQKRTGNDSEWKNLQK